MPLRPRATWMLEQPAAFSTPKSGATSSPCIVAAELRSPSARTGWCDVETREARCRAAASHRAPMYVVYASFTSLADSHTP